MTKKRLLLAMALLTGVGLTAFVLRYLQPVQFTAEVANRPVQFTAEVANRIHPGMTEPEVVAILGAQAGDYQTRTNYLPAPDCYRSNVWINPKGLRHPD